MCEGFFLAASAPLFSFVYTLYATMTGDGIASRASEAAKRIKQIGNLTDPQFRAAHQIVKGYGSNVVLVTGLIATVLSYLTALLSSTYVLGRSALFDLMIISAPVLLLIFSVMVLNSVGPSNLFTHKILAPFKRLHGQVTLPFTYGGLINGAASLCNLLLIIVFAFSYGVISCRPAKDAAGAQGRASLEKPSVAHPRQADK